MLPASLEVSYQLMHDPQRLLRLTPEIIAPLSRAIKKAHPDWIVTAYVRSSKPEAEIIAATHADHVVVGDFSDFEKIKNVAQENQIAINAGNSFTSEPIAAIVAGLKERPESIKGKLIHISGGGNFIDFGTSGNFNPESKVWNDDSEADIRAISKDMFNGQSDTVALEADTDGSVESYIVCPAVVYGGASIASPSIGIGYNLVTGNAKPLGYVPYVGDGTAVLSTTHVLDLMSFLLKIVDVAAAGPAQGSAYTRYYMVETGRVQWKQLATELARIMYEKGVFPTAEPRNVPFEQAGEGEVKHLVAANMLMKGDRAARMGYQAQQPSILAQMAADLKNAQL